MGSQTGSPHAQDHLKRNLYSGLPSLAPLCSPGSPICIATRRPLRKWRGPPQAAHHPAWVRAPPKPISCPLHHSLMSRCDCSRCGLGAWVSEWRGGVGRAGTDSFLRHSSPQSLLYHSVFPSVYSQPKDETGQDLASRLLDCSLYYGVFCVD